MSKTCLPAGTPASTKSPARSVVVDTPLPRIETVAPTTGVVIPAT
jgi:hypothetical protein